MDQREKFGSRLGFLLISAGCAIGLGNVYRFPIITGAYGGALFVLIYLAFLLILGIPVMCAELAVGRASQRSIASSFEVMERPGQKWHLMKYLGIAGNYLLMMFYTVIAGWMLIYFYQFLTGGPVMDHGADVEALGGFFGSLLGQPLLLIATTAIIVVACFLVCSFGLQKGVERITKFMMLALFALIIGLVIYSFTLDGAGAGLKFYLVPSVEPIKRGELGTIITAAMGQAFFTLSVGIGSIAIFGSYIDKKRSLLGEALTITGLDTFVAICAGLIIFPAYFTFVPGATGIDAGQAGAGFLFTTLSGIFNSMGPVVGRVIGTVFFLFMLFAALSTVIAVFENIMSFWLELTKLNRRTVALINIGLFLVLTLPAIFGCNIWSSVKDVMFGKDFIDMEDFIVSNVLLPLGSLVYVLFCTTRFGWGRKNFCDELNAGEGVKMPRWVTYYMTYALPVIIAILLGYSVVNFFR
ncbi:MAG: sodium-dependent transporter [Ruminococcaceae bacterium]|nr:sodium-dependent transporter [Oscillospiraceae bacterium]